MPPVIERAIMNSESPSPRPPDDAGHLHARLASSGTYRCRKRRATHKVTNLSVLRSDTVDAPACKKLAFHPLRSKTDGA